MFSVLTINISTELFGMLLCLIFVLCTSILARDFPHEIRTDFYLLFLCEALALFCDAMAGLLRGKVGAGAGFGVRLFNFCAYFSNYMLIGLFAEYICHILPTKISKWIKGAAWILAGLSALALVLNLWLGFFYVVDTANVYRRARLFWLGQLPGLIMSALVAVWSVVYRKRLKKRERTGFFLFALMPFAAILMQLVLPGITALNIAVILVLIYLFFGMQASVAEELVEQRKVLEEDRLKLMMSQIRPHFLYNSLTSIAQLCEDDPATAKKTTVAFANYLRGNLDSLGKTETIPFRDELRHIRNYLDIEKVRFGDALNVVYDIGTEDFRVPALSVQPIVENAVKHGVGMKEEGGTVTLSVKREEGAVVIRVSDDGVGFDTEKAFRDNGRVGLKNITERLKLMCNAEVTVESAPGRGSDIRIVIPED